MGIAHGIAGVPVGIVASCQVDNSAAVDDLPHGAECIAEIIFAEAALLLCDAVQAVEVGVRAVAQYLRETRVEIESVMDAILSNPVA